ncbi:MAG TPA: 4-(cytidine 5'-diphospho)-2-C-methyl-D-erythritol kinase, partial [Opitutaceae bacterium]|nr:4-(cytidine 5'-diphospho)-2-C-methyl-D-erythritol kinase [Opitutaceae bacterium]
VALPLLLKRLADSFGLVTALSGSGSACFAFSSDSSDDRSMTADIVSVVRETWGREALVVESRLR